MGFWRWYWDQNDGEDEEPNEFPLGYVSETFPVYRGDFSYLKNGFLRNAFHGKGKKIIEEWRRWMREKW